MSEVSSKDGADPSWRPVGGPWLLKFRGVYGWGKRAQLEVKDVNVVDLALPPDDAPEIAGRGVTTQFLPKDIVEDEVPGRGLDATFAGQRLQHRGGARWTLEEGERDV